MIGFDNEGEVRIEPPSITDCVGCRMVFLSYTFCYMSLWISSWLQTYTTKNIDLKLSTGYVSDIDLIDQDFDHPHANPIRSLNGIK